MLDLKHPTVSKHSTNKTYVFIQMKEVMDYKKKKNITNALADDEKSSLASSEGHSHSESQSDLHTIDNRQTV